MQNDSDDLDLGSDDLDTDDLGFGDGKKKRKPDELKSDFAKSIDEQISRMALANDSEHSVSVVFPSRAHRDAFLRAAGWDFGAADPRSLGDKYIDGLQLADRMGIALAPPVKVSLRKPQKRLAKMT